jgi:hypothetical protein
MGIDELLGPDAKTYSPSEPARRCRVVRPPASLEDSVGVTEEGFDSNHVFDVEPGQWGSPGFGATGTTGVGEISLEIGELALPQAGDLCLLVFDDDGDAWMPTWRPTDLAG